MLGPLYTALSGLLANSQGLQFISNNVANLNTPGFKLSDPLFREVINGGTQGGVARGSAARARGGGVSLDSAGLSFAPGEVRQTNNPFDAALDGNGFFVLDQGGGELRYTRAGQFAIDKNGVLIDRASGAKVLIFKEDGGFGAFDIDDVRSFPPKATQEVVVTGTLGRAGPVSTAELPGITVFDRAGTSVTLRARFTRDAADAQRFQVQVLGSDGKEVGTGDLRFGADGTPVLEASRIKITINSTTVGAFDVTLNFGDPGSFAGVVAPENGTSSQLQVLRQDGVARGSLTQTEFTETGELRFTYSNGEMKTAGQLVIAQFDAPEQLRSLGGGTFVAADNVNVKLGRALSDGRGSVRGSSIEASNVDLTQQFTDLITVQQAYRACSQVSSVVNELLQTLIASQRQG